MAIGDKTHKVISCQHVTKTDDQVSQRHEKLGTERIYQHLRNQNLAVGIHTHDRKLSINKYICEECESVNQNDTWHAIKSVKSSLTKISTGPAYLEGKTWSYQLDDKVEPVCTHFPGLLETEENASRLQAVLLNTIEHYKNNHSNCHSS